MTAEHSGTRVWPWPGNVSIRQMSLEHEGIGSDAAMPMKVEVDFEGLGGAPSFGALVEVREGQPELVQWCFRAPEGTRGLRSADFRAINVSAVLERVAETVGVRYEPVADGVWEILGDDEAAARAAIAARRARRRSGTRPSLDDVARVYREGLSTGKPTLAVASSFQIAHRTAALWVQRAREAGKLGPARPGRAGED
ncbi:hypothetical protein [Candidatus Blastococcus massiliensis]|uniref:hypothetical protein n=1 Tax=Candidatus Blastococcus massiliensis TaxID=1470358 RepID=UPI0004B7F660|nr:hypothetical protein [Candidatus Blastococcus massiliensis]